MTAEIITLPQMMRPASSVAHYLRIGDTGHLQLEDLRAEERFPARRVVVDASRFQYQRSLIEALKKGGVEIVLDTKAAELAEPGRYRGYAKGAPWAVSRDGKLLGVDLYSGPSFDELIYEIARIAVAWQVHAVLAPGHYLRNGAADPWFEIDLRACEKLRLALDKFGGSNIAIDYSLIISHTQLRDEAIRGALVKGLDDLPFENLWVRASGFGADGTPAGARHFINALSSMHNLGKPVIADHLGGLIGCAVVAFGATSGLCHGVGEKERFDASNWDQAPPEKSEGIRRGRTRRISVFGLDKSLTIPELNALAKARGGRRLLACQNPQCCLHGLGDMIQNPKAHILHERFDAIRRLAEVPDLNRAEHFLKTDVALADQQSRQIAKLKPVETELRPRKNETLSLAVSRLSKRLKKQADRNEKMRAVLNSLHDMRGQGAPRAPEASFRASQEPSNNNQEEKP